nr:hypothetical protein [uncultured Acetatifactor sp.]
MVDAQEFAEGVIQADQFAFRRIESRKWMVISLLIGNLLMIAIAVASLMYSRAILQRTLTRNLSDYYVEKNSVKNG